MNKSRSVLLLAVTLMVVALATVSAATQNLYDGNHGGRGPTVEMVELSSSECSQLNCVLSRTWAMPGGSPSAPGPGASEYLVILENPTAFSHTVVRLTLFGVSGVSAGGRFLKAYYYTSQEQFNSDGSPASTPVGACTATSYSGCTIFAGAQVLQPGSNQFIVIVADSGQGAVSTPSVYSLSIVWH